jgi:hypothetical protein
MFQMPLIDEVNEKRKEIRTDGYAMSVSEWASIYEDEEIDIHPEFQRIYRWSDAQKTSLIESILLGIPIPPVFVSQRDDGIWDVVDGLQRLSTLFQLMGILKDDDGNIIDPLVLLDTKYLPSLKGQKWNDSDNPDNSLSNELKLIIKRSKIHVSIILKESDDSAKYDLFQRLNTGGSNLSAQEVRNCILVMLNKDFYSWLESLATYPAFQECIALSDRPLQESYHLELALRFLVFGLIEKDDLDNLGDVGVFITEKMREIASDPDFNYKKWDKLFKNTFDLLQSELSEKSFKRYNTEKSKFQGGFLVTQYEVVAYGLAYNLNENIEITDLEEKIASIWSNKHFADWSGSGVTAARRLPRLSPFGRELFGNGD